MEKSFKICPALLTKDSLDIVEQSTAYIPCRKTGLRVEREVKGAPFTRCLARKLISDTRAQRRLVCHSHPQVSGKYSYKNLLSLYSYGHCGNGYEMSFGRAQKAVQLTQTCF